MASVSGTSTCTEAMLRRSHAGSKSALAKRSASRFCTASLPRKWSMRKTCSSSKTSCTSRSSSSKDCEVEAERLLDHQAGPLGQPLAPEHADHPGHRGRWHRQVDDAAHVVTEALLDLPHPSREVRAVVGVGGLERHPVEQVARDVLVEVVDRLAQPLAHLVAEVVVRAGRVPPAADDGVVLGQSAGRGEPVEPREQLARREVAAGAEQQEDAGRQRGGRHARHANDHPKEWSGAGGGLSCCCRPPARRRRPPHHSRDWGRARPRSRRTPGPRRRGRPRPARAGRTCRP